MSTAALAPPQGWTNDPVHLQYEYHWQGRDGDTKEMLQKEYGISDPQPLITREPKFGDVLFVFQSKEGGETKHYIWNEIESDVCEIKSPTSTQEIYDAINEREGYLSGLEFETVVALPAPDGE